MKKLETELRKNSHNYKLIERTENVALYEQFDEGICVGFEVFKVKVKPDTNIKGRIIEGGEKYPSNEDFGVIAWCFTTQTGTQRELGLKNAYVKFNELKKESITNEDKTV